MFNRTSLLSLFPLCLCSSLSPWSAVCVCVCAPHTTSLARIQYTCYISCLLISCLVFFVFLGDNCHKNKRLTGTIFKTHIVSLVGRAKGLSTADAAAQATSSRARTRSRPSRPPTRVRWRTSPKGWRPRGRPSCWARRRRVPLGTEATRTSERVNKPPSTLLSVISS